MLWKNKHICAQPHWDIVDSLTVEIRSSAELLQSCLTFCNPLDCSPPGSCIHGILQGRILERGTIYSSRGSSQPRDRTQGSHTAGRFFTVWSTRKLPTFGNSLEISDYICAQFVEQCIKITFWDTHTLQWGQNNSGQFHLTGVSKGLISELLLD